MIFLPELFSVKQKSKTIVEFSKISQARGNVDGKHFKISSAPRGQGVNPKPVNIDTLWAQIEQTSYKQML